MRWRLAVPFLLVFAGCVGTSDVPAGPSPTAPQTGFESDCPPGGTPRAGLCVATLREATASLQEPFVAVGEGEPPPIAIGVNRGRGADSLEASGWHPLRLEVFVSLDRASTWRRDVVPLPEDGAPSPDRRVTSDPAILWNGSRLIVSGLVTTTHGSNEDLIFAASDDAGGTWAATQRLTSDRTAGRNWMVRDADGRLFLLYNHRDDRGRQLEIAWTDDERNWNRLGASVRVPDCSYPTITLAPNGPLVACSGTMIRVFSFADDGAMEPRSELDVGATFTTFISATTERLWMAAQVGHEDVVVAHSPDEGRNWSLPRSLREQGMLPDHPWVELMYATTDPNGGFHLLLKSNASCSGTCIPYRSVQVDGTHVYFPADGSTPERRLLFERTRPDPLEEPMDPGTWDDGFWGIAFNRDGFGIAAWTHAEAIEYTFFYARNEGHKP